jgi:ATP phosphoribosyltransferase regulatory subunit
MISKPWLLPDGVEEILPEQAITIELLRREILDEYFKWGYKLVIPPLLEYSDSLLGELGRDMCDQTFQFGDSMSSKLLALRADITPQIARMDAHSLCADTQSHEDVNRLCYVGTTVKSNLASSNEKRLPLTLGAELYGDNHMEADCEVILLMLKALDVSDIGPVTLSLGDVSIFRELIKDIPIEDFEQRELFDAIQRKAQLDIDRYLDRLDVDDELRLKISSLASLHGNISVLDEAEKIFHDGPQSILHSIKTLRDLAQELSGKCQDVQCYFDLSEMPTYHYHSGLVFSALVPGVGYPVAKGGRYDDVGQVFGRARPATGFNVELETISLLTQKHQKYYDPVYALNDSEHAWAAIEKYRNKGCNIIITRQKQVYESAPKKLIFSDGDWVILG